MNIIVCIKYVPLICSEKAKSGSILDREKTTQVINPYDLYALEAALEIRDRLGGKAYITTLSMGPITIEDNLRQMYYLGVDQVILLSDKTFAGADTLATGYTLQKAVEKIEKFDLIICGQQSADGDTGQVGPILAGNLQIPFITQVQQILEIKSDFMLCERVSDYEYQTVKIPVPALICVKNLMNNPRSANLRDYFKKKNREVVIWNIESINADEKKCGHVGSATKVMEILRPEINQECEFIDCKGDNSVEKLLKIIVQKGLMRCN